MLPLACKPLHTARHTRHIYAHFWLYGRLPYQTARNTPFLSRLFP